MNRQSGVAKLIISVGPELFLTEILEKSHAELRII